jgi:hypothetical protein
MLTNVLPFLQPEHSEKPMVHPEIAEVVDLLTGELVGAVETMATTRDNVVAFPTDKVTQPRQEFGEKLAPVHVIERAIESNAINADETLQQLKEPA